MLSLEITITYLASDCCWGTENSLSFVHCFPWLQEGIWQIGQKQTIVSLGRQWMWETFPGGHQENALKCAPQLAVRCLRQRQESDKEAQHATDSSYFISVQQCKSLWKSMTMMGFCSGYTSFSWMFLATIRERMQSKLELLTVPSSMWHWHEVTSLKITLHSY